MDLRIENSRSASHFSRLLPSTTQHLRERDEGRVGSRCVQEETCRQLACVPEESDASGAGGGGNNDEMDGYLPRRFCRIGLNG